MRILGLSYMYHDSSACLLQDGAVVAAAAEERFSRIKHSLDFPLRAARYCLEAGGAGTGDLDAVVFYEKPFLKFERILKTHLMSFPRSWRNFRTFLPMWLQHKLLVPRKIREELGYGGPVYFTDHHYAHAASAFLASPFEEAMILTVDGTGEWSTLCCGTGRDAEIRLERDIRFPHSLGLLYSAVTAHLGFEVNGGEGKVMGLAAHGRPSFKEAFERVLHVREDGSFRLDLDFFSYHYDLVMTNRRFAGLFGEPRLPEDPILDRHADLAATLQAALEDVLVRIVLSMRRSYGLERLCIAGGVGLNCAANARILERTPVRELFVQPAAGDDGCSLGAALYLHSRLVGGRSWRMQDAYLGPAFSDEEIEAFLRRAGARFERLEEPELAPRAASLLAQGGVVGWFQGRMEFGPRALGNRSILADPRDAAVRERLNRRIKRREPFRPFAPVVCREDFPTYFEGDRASPYMLLSFPVRPERRGDIPAVVHADGSARVQTVEEASNPRLYRLLKAFGARTGIPVLLNTSFNLHGEPMVCSPQDAYESFHASGMDALILGRHLVAREERP